MFKKTFHNFFDMQYFLDTNILLDIFDESRTTSPFTYSFLQKHSYITTSCSEDMITTFFYLATKKNSNEKIIYFWEKIYEACDVLSFGENVVIAAFEYCKTNKNSDLEDVLQAFCAKKNGCDALITHDKNFPKDILPIIHP